MYQTIKLKEKPDDIAPDGLEIRQPVKSNSCGFFIVHLLQEKTSSTIRSKVSKENWYFLELKAAEVKHWLQGSYRTDVI